MSLGAHVKVLDTSKAQRAVRPTVLLTAYIGLLLAVPSELSISAIGGLGRPALLFGLVLGLVGALWIAGSPTRRPASTVSLASLAFLVAGLASYIVSMLRPMEDAELNAADMGIIRLISWCSLVIFTSEALARRGDLISVVARLVWSGTAFAALGLIQFITHEVIVDGLTIPGMTSDQSFSSVEFRGGFARVAATAMNPLEYGAVLCVIFPLSLGWAAGGRGSRIVRALPACCIGLAIAISVSRSSLLAAAAGLLVLLPLWPSAARRALLAAVGVAAISVYALVPGMAGTVRGLFLTLPVDASATSRTEGLPFVASMFGHWPLFGRGIGTLLPEYRILDNQYLVLLLEVGLLGLLAFGAVITIACWSAFRSALSQERCVEAGIPAAIASGAVMAGLFDMFAFPMAVGTLFLVIGLAGAHARIVREEGVIECECPMEAPHICGGVRDTRA